MVHVRGSESIMISQVRPGDGPAFRAIRLEAIADSPTAFGSSLAETEARPPQYWDQRVASAATGYDNILFVAESAGHWLGNLRPDTSTGTDSRLSSTPTQETGARGRQIV
jgi:hypothetical protein